MVARADWLFAVPGIVLVLMNGLALAGDLYGWENIQDLAWITSAIVLFALSGVVWAGFLLRYQAAMADLGKSPSLRSTRFGAAWERFQNQHTTKAAVLVDLPGSLSP